MIEPLLTAKQVAELLGCRVNSVYELAGRGELPSYKVAGVGRRFRETEIERWLEAQRAPGAVTRLPAARASAAVR